MSIAIGGLVACSDSDDPVAVSADSRVAGTPADASDTAAAISIAGQAVVLIVEDNWNDLIYQFGRLGFQTLQVPCANASGGGGSFNYQATDVDGNKVASAGDTIRFDAADCQIGQGSPVYRGVKAISINAVSGDLATAFNASLSASLIGYSIFDGFTTYRFGDVTFPSTLSSSDGVAWQGTMTGPIKQSFDFSTDVGGGVASYRLFDFKAGVLTARAAAPVATVTDGLFEVTTPTRVINGSLR